MKNKNTNRVFRFNRRIRGRTDYLQRLKLLKSGLTRLVVRRSNTGVLIQFVNLDAKGDKVVVSARSTELKKLGLTLNTGNVVSAYLTGLLAGKRLLDKKFSGEVIVDIGLANSFKGGRIYSAVKGVLDSGVKVRVSESVFPSEERLSGAHLKAKDVAGVIAKVKKAIGVN